MKVITLQQPWAALIALGVKTVLTYPFATTYTGPVVIKADRSQVAIDDPYIANVLRSNGMDPRSLPLDRPVARGKLAGCEQIRRANVPCYPEYAFSEFKEGWYAWKLSGIWAISS